MNEEASYVVSGIDDQRYAVPALNVRSIIEVEEITHVPGAPSGVLGVLNLRGDVIPVIEYEETSSNCEEQLALVIEVREKDEENDEEEIVIALLIDEVMHVTSGEMQKDESQNMLKTDAAIQGVFSLNEEPVLLLDVVQLIPASNEVIA